VDGFIEACKKVCTPREQCEVLLRSRSWVENPASVEIPEGSYEPDPWKCQAPEFKGAQKEDDPASPAASATP